MDMKLDKKIIKSRRSAKAWSQEHLSHVAGLGVRTIQRAESSGLTSYESALAIASALEMSVADLILPEPTSAVRGKRVQVGLLLTIALGLLLLAGYRTVLADQIVLEMNATLDQNNKSEAKRTQAVGESAEFQISSEYQLVVSPTILENGDVQLSMILSKHDGEQYTQIAQPQIVTPNQHAATLQSEFDGTSITIEITPTVN